MLANNVRIVLAISLVSAIAYGCMVVDRWHRDSVKLKKLMPIAVSIDEERSALSDQVVALTADKTALKEQISNQNHAIELAKVAADNAKALQEQARTSAAREQLRAQQRIAQLQADLADSTKTITDMLDNSWSQPR